MTEVPSAEDRFRTMPGTTLMELTVLESARVTPGMQRLRLTAPELAGLEYQPGQDVMLLVARDGGRPVRRRYSIRGLDRDERLLTLDIVRHAGGGPGEQWVAAARPGMTVEGIGPRGKVFPDADADWHLFVGDESALAAIFSMVASLPPQATATVILEIPDAADEQELHAQAKADLTWLPRSGGPPGESRGPGEPGALVAAARAVHIPAGVRPHAYLIGEARVVLALREALAERGFDPAAISPKAYWGRGRGNATHGEPARDQ
ncbi:MAG TPA: siderophore-interacting protein [Streptosporangiaceae bacterium]|jgi:NADPH-dependent ferric siderophore reductase